MPTWRGTLTSIDEASQGQLRNLKALFDYLDVVLPNSISVWVRLHPLIRGALDLSQYARLKTFPDDVEPYEHLARCDALVTDYSSVLFDFATTGRPIFLFTPDAEVYRKERDFCIDIGSLPFEMIVTPEVLALRLSSLANDNEYSSSDLQHFLHKFCRLDNGGSTEDLCVQYFLGESKVEVREVIPDTKKKNILLFGGAFLNNGITTSVKTLVSLIDKERFNILLWVDAKAGERNALEYFRSLDDCVSFIPTGNWLAVSPFEAIRVLARDVFGHSWEFGDRFNKLVWQREWRRLFDCAKLDVLVHFSGYERRISFLLSICSIRKIIFVHNEMSEEIQRKGVDARALVSAYRTADAIALVREGLDEKFNASVMDISGKVEFVPNTLKLNCRKLSNEPLFDAIAAHCAPEVKAHLRHLLEREAAFRFLNVGRFSLEKGQERLIQAFERVWKEFPACQLFVIGGYGPIYESLLQRVRDSPARAEIFLAKGSSNPFPIFARMSALVLSSYYEGRPLSIYESFALNLPVISTDIPGPAELLRRGYGLVVENSVEGLVEGMKAALRGEIPQRPYDFEAHNRFALEQFYKAVGR
jgi:CDP-glycerol glycerophosphotransferase